MTKRIIGAARKAEQSAMPMRCIGKFD